MPASNDASELRARASALRSLARRLEQSALVELPGLGGDDTWRGPSAWAFQEDARRAVRLLDDAIDSALRAARALEVAAAEAAHRA
jgi:hypothetical protein